MDYYANPRVYGVRIVQYAVVATGIGVSLIAASEGDLPLALVLGVIGALCVVAFELYYIRKYVTRIRGDASGWVLLTLSTFGERPVRFDPAEATLGTEITQNVRYGGVNYHYPLYVGATRYILDSTPPVQFDAEALRRALKS